MKVVWATMLVATAAAGNVEVLEEVGSAGAQCDASKPVTVVDESDNLIRLGSGGEAEIRFAVTTSEFSWSCGDETMRAGSTAHFNQVQAERGDSGDITWTFYINHSK